METTYNYQILPTGGMASAPNPGGSGAYPGANAWTGIPVLSFTNGTKIILVWTHTNRIVIRFSFEASGDDNWGDDIVLYDAAQAEPLFMSAQRAQVINYVSGSIAQYQIMGQW